MLYTSIEYIQMHNKFVTKDNKTFNSIQQYSIICELEITLFSNLNLSLIKNTELFNNKNILRKKYFKKKIF